ncbi:hypothetical protein BDY19DRAFT_987002 [Irpex rosettiformis]|uniref:Uncharacterized protein n=1 Tax=Irpex rosettiformis TaxID=378272 RepID=A0ACB8TU16_9APHY|nr:hypothetical protein BDY19DRAFT_987002 [Irpex rosettiformis]
MQRRESTLDMVPEDHILHENPVDMEEEEAEEETEWDLEERGLYPGSYRRIVALYTFVPLVSLVVLVFLAACPSLFWPTRAGVPQKNAPYFPFPIPQVVLSAALWSFGYLLRAPTYSVVSFVLQKLHPIFATLLFNAVYVFIYNILRLSSLPILRVREAMKYGYPSCHDGIFRTVWWLAFGWATIDVSVSIVQSYAQIDLYRSVMVPQERVADILAEGSETPQLLSASQEILPLSPRHESPKDGEDNSAINPVDEAIRLAVDQDLEQLVNLKEREDVEEIYGLPVIKIPVFVSCLQRTASILLSMGVTLTLFAAYLRSNLSKPISNSSTTDSMASNDRPFLITFPLILLLNLFLHLVHTPLILPRVGVHSAAYVSFLLGLGIFFTGLGMWGALS